MGEACQQTATYGGSLARPFLPLDDLTRLWRLFDGTKSRCPMQRFTIQYAYESTESCCPACGMLNVAKKGPRLFPHDSDDPICRDCGKRLAPNLVALLDLAHVADKVSRRARHMLTPSMESLLDLARAAEDYSHSAPKMAMGAR